MICPGGMMSAAVTQVMDRCGAAWPEAHLDAGKMADLGIAMREAAGFDNIALPFCMTVEAESFGADVDIGSRTVQPRVRGFALDADADFKLPAPQWHGGRAVVLLDALARSRHRESEAVIVGNVVGPFSLLGMLVDPLKIMRWTRRSPERLSGCLTVLAGHLGEFARRQVAAGADIICIAEPTATGEILGGDKFAEFVAPRINEIAAAVRSACARVIVHICGDVSRIGNELKTIDTDALSVDAMVDIIALARSDMHALMMGNLSAFMLASASTHDIARRCRALLAGGVRLIAPACGIIPDTPVANLRAMSEALRDAPVAGSGDRLYNGEARGPCSESKGSDDERH